MIEIYECTDCKYCADFDFSDRVYCLRPDLPANEVCLYSPVADNKDAEDCIGFREGNAHVFPYKAIGEYEKWCMEKYSDVTYRGVREWIELQLKKESNA